MMLLRAEVREIQEWEKEPAVAAAASGHGSASEDESGDKSESRRHGWCLLFALTL